VAAIVALGALVPATGAQACSCVAQDPAEALRAADAAIVARLTGIVRRGELRADYRYRIRRVYKGGGDLRRGQVISVRSALQAAACGLPQRQDRPTGLFLARDEQARWSGGLCGMIDPKRLWRVSRLGPYASRDAGASSSCAS
jgi:hypothetical protein